MQKKYAILIFSKPPIPGLVKTRLTIERGGGFTQEQAAQFFKRSLWDVTELAMWCMDHLYVLNAAEREADPSAPERSYDLFISTTPEKNVALMKETIEGNRTVAARDSLHVRSRRHLRRSLRYGVSGDLRPGLRGHRLQRRRHSHDAHM